MAEDLSAVVDTLDWTQDGTLVTVAPPARNPTGGDAKLYAYISAHTSYVSAMAASHNAVGADSSDDSMAPLLNASPPSKRKRQGPFHMDEDGAARGDAGSGGSFDATRGKGAGRKPGGRVSDDDGAGEVDDGVGSVRAGGDAGAGGNIGAGVDVGAGGEVGGGGDVAGCGAVGTGCSASAGGAAGACSAAGAVAAASRDDDGDGVGDDVGGGLACDLKRLVTPRGPAFMRRKKAAPVVSSGLPHILGLRRVLTKCILTALVIPLSADDGFHSADALDAVLREVVMDVHGIGLSAATEMLKNGYRPADQSASGRGKTGSAAKKAKEPAPVALRLWLGKTRNNPH